MAYDLSQLDSIAAQYGLDPTAFRAYAKIESGGDPSSGAGTPYKGLFQLSSDEFAKGGGTNIFDGTENAKAAAVNLAAESKQFTAQFGRQPSATELYMIHQQGFAGATAHLANPNGIAWQNVARYYPDAATAKQAVWNNVPDDVKAKFPGGVDTLTSGQFLDLWGQKVAGFTGQPATGPHWAPGGTAASGTAGAPGALASAAGSAPSPALSKLALLSALQPPAQLSVAPTAQQTGSTGSTAAPPNMLAAGIRPAVLDPSLLAALRAQSQSA